MNPLMNVRQLKARQHGVSIISAIFLLLLFAAIAAFMVSMMTTANITSAQDVQGSRAYQAAQAGAEWGLYQLDPNGSAAALPACVSGVRNEFPGFTVTVVCTRYPGAATSYAEAGRTIAIYRIVATAAVTGVLAPPAATEREVRITVERCRDPAIVAAPFDC